MNMRKAFAIASAVCLAIVLFAGTALAAETGSPSAVMDSTDPTELLPVDVLTYADQLEIRKIYELSPGVDPGRLPRDGFERSGYAYECADILREVVIGEESKTVTVTETAESPKNDSTTVLGLLPQYKEYTDEDGFAGNLLLNTATIKSEVSGYGNTRTPYTVSRSYPNLANADTQYLPKTIDDNGRMLQLQDVQWQTDNTYNVDDYEIGSRYSAIVTYGGTKTSSYVRGYDITADYTGEVLRKGVTVIRYTVIFAGTEIPVPEPTPEPTVPEPVPVPTEPPDPIPFPAQESGSVNMIWLPILLSILALLGCGACAYFILKNRKEIPHYEKASGYDYADPYPDSHDSNPGDGDGDSERT